MSAPGEKSGFRQDGEDQVVPPPEVKPGPAPEPEPPVQPSPSKEGGLLPLKDVRVLIGKARRTGQDVFWEFGNPQLSNRHLLITGTSGQGKTYAIQTLLFELARQGISSVVFDYTDGFLPGKLETEFETMLGDNLVEYYAIANPLPVNPFRQQTISLPGTTFPEKPAATATRFAAIMKHVYSFGEQQRGALYSACRKGIERYGERMSFPILQEMLKQEGTSYAKTVLSKMQHLIDMNLFDSGKALNWSWLTRRDGKVTVFQLTSLDRDTQTILTEILLWDAWYSLEKTGDPDSPFVVVLDEAQNLSFTDGSPAQKILQEGRKYGWSAWFATQFMKGALSSDEISRLQQAPVSLHFRPSDEETGSVAQGLADRYTDASSWVHSLKSLQKGICVVKGDRLRPDGTFGSVPPAIVQVSNFGQRVREEAVSTAEPAAT